MTRIFGLERKSASDEHIPNGVSVVLDNLQEAVEVTYERGDHTFGLGFILVDETGARGVPVFRGYQGIKSTDNIQDLLPAELHLALANAPRAFFGVLQNVPDEGIESFKNGENKTQPLESENWLVMTMGSWGNGEFNDTNLPWYNNIRPSMSIIQYLESNPEQIDFDWIDPKRTPYIVAVKKDGSEVHVVDRYSDFNEKGFSFVREELNGMVYHHGVRNADGKQV